MVTYYGPHFSTFAIRVDINYICEYFQRVLFIDPPVAPLLLTLSTSWSDDAWHSDQTNRKFIKNAGPICLNGGTATGVLFGGSLSCLRLLQGTPYFPSIKEWSDSMILFLEDDDLVGSQLDVIFEQQIHSLFLSDANLKNIVKGILIGRCQIKSEMSLDKFKYIFDKESGFLDIPIILNLDFGHTTPIFTLPIGGLARMSASPSYCQVELIHY